MSDDGQIDEPDGFSDGSVDVAPTSEPADQPVSRQPAIDQPAAGPGVIGVVTLPGVALWRKSPIVASLLFAAGVIAPFYGVLLVVLHRNELVALVVRPGVLRGFALVGVATVASRAIAVWLTADRLADPYAQRACAWVGSVAVAALTLPTALGVMRLEQARGTIDKIFADSPDAGRVTLAEPTPDPYAGQFHTVLLMGSDEGTDRVGMRTDSLILAVIHTPTGRAALISVPRNLVHLQFPPGTTLADEYPDGYDDDEGGLISAIYINVENDPDLVEEYETDLVPAGVSALMHGISYSFGVNVDDYLLVNSCGFVHVVDAIGGVTIEVDKELPMPAMLPCSNYRLTPTIGPGVIFMDGTKALGYVRSRMADSDYQRMERQRILLQTIAEEIGFRVLLTNFGELLDAIEGSVRTTMTAEEALGLVTILQGHDDDLQSLGLVPPLFEPSEPDFDGLRTLMLDVRRALAEGTPVADLVPTTDGTDSTDGPTSGTGGDG